MEASTSNIERATVGQGNNELWHKIRKGKITASRVGTIVKRKQITEKFVSDYKFPKDISKFPALHWGTTKESSAKHDYAAITGNSVRDCGIFVSKECDWIAGTPDGLVRDTNDGTDGIMEIKCPYSIRTQHPLFCFKKLAFTDNRGKLRRNHNYHYQIQTQLYASEYTWCDFVIWTPVGLHVERIKKDDSFMTNHVIPKLHHFFTEHFTCDN